MLCLPRIYNVYLYDNDTENLINKNHKNSVFDEIWVKLNNKLFKENLTQVKYTQRSVLTGVIFTNKIVQPCDYFS
jgi:phosphotransferase system IIA component